MKEKDDLWHYTEECEETVDWFRGNKKEIWEKRCGDLYERKGEILVKIWKAKEKIVKES